MSNFRNLENVRKYFENIFNIFFSFPKFPPKTKFFEKNEIHIKGQWLMNMCAKFQVDILTK